MPKASKKSYYAVCVGREGPKIYRTWDECKQNTSRYPGARHRGFATYQDAQNWLASALSLTSNSTRESSTTSDSAAETVFTASIPPKTANSSAHIRKQTPLTPMSDDSDIEIIDATPLGANSSSTAEIILSPEQKQVLKKVERGENVFFTGSAGTGKSVLLREIVRYFRTSCKKVAITASTGIAAVNIGGSTVHSWAGIGLGEESTKTYVGKFRGQKKLRNVWERWRNVNALIIDEISMLDGVLFDKLECIGRELRGNHISFGGIQLVLSGDFCQLPPVPSKRDSKKAPTIFAFEAQTWDCVGPPVVLKKVFRQRDQGFVNMLNEMRFGTMSESTIKAFKALDRNVIYDDGVQPTELFPHRADVDRANNTRLSSLPGEPHTYCAMDIPGKDVNGNLLNYAQMDRLLERLVVPKSVTLKVGAQVMLVKNLEQGSLVNGSVGTIIKFSTSRKALQNGISIARIERQNMLFEPMREHKQETQEQEEEDENNPSSNARVWPVVRFTNGREILCIPLEFSVNSPLGIMEARRDQIPLILAWALSIHKSQGQTLERVKVDLGKVFEKGQAYVALSRATSLNHLQVLNFDPSKVTAHPTVLMWYNSHFSGGPKIANANPEVESDYHNDDEMEMDDYEAIAIYHDSF